MAQAHDREKTITRALEHELRCRILRFTAGRDEPSSPRIMSDELDHPLSNVSYHVRQLREAQLLAEIDRKPVRGSIEHFYLVDPKAAQLPQVAAVLGSA